MNKVDNISFTLVKEDRKTLAIHVLPDLSIIVKAPKIANDNEIENFISRKKSWVYKQLNYFRQFNLPISKLESGTEFFYLGNQYKIVIKKSQDVREYIDIENNVLIIYSIFPRKSDRNNEILSNWINYQAEKQFLSMLKKCIKKFPNMELPKLKVREMQKRWGSFLKPNTVILNPKLIQTPKKCIEYVVIHELCHFYHHDHSAAFYSLLGAKMSDWTKAKDKLEALYSPLFI